MTTPPALVWLAWTTPEHLKKWFTPAPWQTVDCEINLRPGGVFRTVMRSPEGQEFPNLGCYLEIIPNEQLVWTSALPCDQFAITATISLAPHGSGTQYSARVAHADEASRQKHADMKFEEGWGTGSIGRPCQKSVTPFKSYFINTPTEAQYLTWRRSLDSHAHVAVQQEIEFLFSRSNL
jgi:uncharacterized protein YndB with AHSA1/START domain